MSLCLAYVSVIAALLSGIAALGANRRTLVPTRIRSWIERFANSVVKHGMEDVFAEKRYENGLRRLVFVLLGISGATALTGGLVALLGKGVLVDQLPFGLPWLHWHVRLDALSGFFFAIIGIAVMAVSFYGPGYVRANRRGRHPFGLLGLATGIFIAGMELVLLADDAFFFVIAWELMSVSSYFLVAYQHEHSANRRAAFLYLLMAEVGAIAIILGFGVLAAFSANFTFDALRAADLSSGWSSIAFGLALLGFGMKAGLVPIHAWLPEAHPVAPSHISALMSGVMLKVAVYGLIRFTLDLLGDVQWEWGMVMLVFGTGSAVLGVLYAVVQTNLKRLLAYSSVENIGIIFMALGLSIIFLGRGHTELGVIGLIAALYHVLNHALFKNLLFMSAGSVLHQTHEHDLEHMGGLIRRMPKTAAIFLIGSLAIAALPPMNGFASEWLVFQTALQASSLQSGILRSAIPVTAAVLAFTSAVAATTFVKVYGVAFLGKPRSRHVGRAHEVSHPGMLAGPGLLAGLCLLFGLMPAAVIDALDNISDLLLGRTLPSASASGWLWLTPGSREMASYAPILVLFALVGVVWIAWNLSNRPGTPSVRRAGAWDCGFGGLSSRMQYTGNAFSQPIRRILKPVWELREEAHPQVAPGNALQVIRVRYHLEIADRSWNALYAPITHWIETMARRVSRIQSGNIRTYIAYSFFTLVILLGVVSR
jgi:hydrogenase-4 component B